MDTTEIKTPVKIAFVTPKVYPLFNPQVDAVFGGAEVDVYFLATELAKNSEFQVSCVVADYGQESVETREGVQLIKSLDFRHNPLSGAQKIWKALRRVDADIYFVKTASPGVPLVAWFCRRHHKHFVYRTAHSRECDGTWLRQHRLWGQAFKWSLRNAGVVFAQNQTDAQNLHETIGVSSVVLPNGHRIPDVDQQPRETILWVARSVAFKQPFLFLDLAQKYPQQHFTMICQKATGDLLFDQIRQQASALPNVDFIPRVPFHQIDDYFLRAKVFVSTSAAEGFANTFIQATRCGTPILSLAVNPDDFLNRYQCGLCANGDHQRFDDLLKDLLNPQTAKTLGQNAQEYAKKNHNIQSIAQQYIKIFDEIL